MTGNLKVLNLLEQVYQGEEHKIDEESLLKQIDNKEVGRCRRSQVILISFGKPGSKTPRIKRPAYKQEKPC